MITVRVTCPACGDILTTPDRVTLTPAWAGTATWRATCQHCGGPCGGPCAGPTARLLEEAGCRIAATVARPAELDDRARRTRRPALTAGHLADFRRALNDAGRFDAAVAALQAH